MTNLAFEPIIGYDLCIPYNHTIMVDNDRDRLRELLANPSELTSIPRWVLEKLAAAPPVPRCPACGLRSEFFQHRSDYSTRERVGERGSRRKHDIALTYDHQLIVSRTFREFCEANEYPNLEFLGFANDPEHFQLRVLNIIRLDRAWVQLGKMCPVCRRHDHVLSGRGNYVLYGKKAGTVVFEATEPLADGIHASDLWLGSAKRCPVIVVGAETRQKIATAKLSGRTMRPAFGILAESELSRGEQEPREGSQRGITAPVRRAKRRRKREE